MPGRRRGRRDIEIRDEIQFYLEERARELEEAGLAPEEARREALKAFGDPERVAAEVRRADDPTSGGRWRTVPRELVQDVAHARRALLRSPGFTAVAVLTLALGIGASTALFGAADAVLLRTLPVPDADRLVLLAWSSPTVEMAASVDDRPALDPATGVRTSRTFSTRTYERLRDAPSGLASVFAFARIEQLNVGSEGEAEIASGQFVSGDYHSGLGLEPLLGRTIAETDDLPGAQPVAVLSHGYWLRRFGGDPDVIGRTATLNGVPFTVVGVTPAAFSGTLDLGEAPDVSVPLAFEPALRPGPGESNTDEPWNWWLFVMGRLEEGATTEVARAGLEGVFQRSAVEGWEALPSALRERPEFQGPRAVPALEVRAGSRGLDSRRGANGARLRVLAAVVAGLLLIACANVAGLILARSESRQREIAIRTALGASRRRVARQLTTEGLVLGLAGAVPGVLLAYLAGDRVLAWLPAGGGAPLPAAVVDLRVLTFAVALSVLTGALVGAGPALSVTGRHQWPALVGAGRSTPRSRDALRTSFAVAQVSLSFVLLTLAGLLTGTLRNLERVELGFDPTDLLLFRVDPRLSGYEGPEIRELYEAIVERLEALPGVRSATLSRHPLLAGSFERTGDGLFVHGPGADVQEGTAYLHRVRWNFFATMDMQLLAGRGLTPADDGSAPRVAVVNEALARAYFPGGDAVGGRFSFGSPAGAPFEVVGVVRDAKYTGQREGIWPTIYVHYLQAGPTQMSVAVRSEGDPSALVPPVRAAVRAVDADLPLFELRTQVELANERLSTERRLAGLSSLVGAAALFLTCLGLYGTVAWRVSRRVPEIGVRIALGAPRQRVLTSVLAETMTLVAFGLGLGLLAAHAAARLVADQLFGLVAGAPGIRASAALVMLAVAAAAAYLPARRASRVDPVVALRQD